MHIHAHLIIAPQLDTTLIPQEVRVSSADVLHASIAQFGIEDARSLTESASRRPIAASHRTFVLWTDTMTREAQNALLKLFEEPPAGGVFYLMVPDESMLIPTLRSRLIRAKMHALDTESGEAIAFLQCSYADRLATIAKLQKEKDTKRMHRSRMPLRAWFRTNRGHIRRTQYVLRHSSRHACERKEDQRKCCSSTSRSRFRSVHGDYRRRSYQMI